MALCMCQVSFSLCPTGKQDAGTSLICQGCPPGTSNTAAGGLCRSCEPGKFSREWNSSRECSLCAVGTAAPDSGSATCEVCGGNSFGNQEGLVQCVLCSGQYVRMRNGRPLWCSPCGPGMECVGRDVRALTGNYIVRRADGLLTALPCRPGACAFAGDGLACTTISGNASEGDLGVFSCCTDNRINSEDNVLCGRCRDGFQDTGGGDCTPCPGPNYPLLFGGFALSFVAVYGFHSLSQTSSGSVKVELVVCLSC